MFANGAHGSGLGKGDPALDQWPGLLETGSARKGLLDRRQIRGRRQVRKN